MDKPRTKRASGVDTGRLAFQSLVFLAAFVFIAVISLSHAVLADEDPATSTVESIISTSTVSDLTSTDTSTTSLDSNGIIDALSDIAPDISAGPTSSDATSTPVSSDDSAATSTDENPATSSDAVSDDTSASSTAATSSDNASAGDATSTSATSTDQTGDSVSAATSTDSTSTDSVSAPEATSSDDSVSTSTDDASETETQTPAAQTQAEQMPAPVVESAPAVSSVISPILSGTFKSGRIPVIVAFDQNVFVTGTPQILLDAGGDAPVPADYVSGSGSRFVIFLYYIRRGDHAAPLDYANSSALALNGGSIKAGDGTDAALALPEPGTSGSLSLSASTDIAINSPPQK